MPAEPTTRPALAAPRAAKAVLGVSSEPTTGVPAASGAEHVPLPDLSDLAKAPTPAAAHRVLSKGPSGRHKVKKRSKKRRKATVASIEALPSEPAGESMLAPLSARGKSRAGSLATRAWSSMRGSSTPIAEAASTPSPSNALPSDARSRLMEAKKRRERGRSSKARARSQSNSRRSVSRRRDQTSRDASSPRDRGATSPANVASQPTSPPPPPAPSPKSPKSDHPVQSHGKPTLSKEDEATVAIQRRQDLMRRRVSAIGEAVALRARRKELADVERRRMLAEAELADSARGDDDDERSSDTTKPRSDVGSGTGTSWSGFLRRGRSTAPDSRRGSRRARSQAKSEHARADGAGRARSESPTQANRANGEAARTLGAARRKMSTLTSSAASSLVSKARTALRRASTAAHVVSVLVATQQQRDQVGLAPGLIEEGDEDGDAALPEASLALAGPMSYMQLALTAPCAWGIAQEVDKCASTSEAVALDGESEFATSPGSPRDQHEAPRLCAVYASLMSAKRLGIACHAARVEVAAWVKSGVVDGGAAALEMVVEVLTSHVEFCVDAVSPVMHGAAHQRWDDDELHRFLAALGDDKRLSQFVEPRATACCRVLHTDRVIAVCARNALSLSLTTMLQTARATQQGEDAAAFAPVLLRGGSNARAAVSALLGTQPGSGGPQLTAVILVLPGVLPDAPVVAAELAVGCLPTLQPWTVLAALGFSSYDPVAWEQGPPNLVSIDGWRSFAVRYLDAALFGTGASGKQAVSFPSDDACSALLLALGRILIATEPRTASKPLAPALPRVLCAPRLRDAERDQLRKYCLECGASTPAVMLALHMVLQSRLADGVAMSDVTLLAMSEVMIPTSVPDVPVVANGHANHSAQAPLPARRSRLHDSAQRARDQCLASAVEQFTSHAGGALIAALFAAVEGCKASADVQLVHGTAVANEFKNIEHSYILEAVAELCAHRDDVPAAVFAQLVGWLNRAVGPTRACRVLMLSPRFVACLPTRDALEYLVESAHLAARVASVGEELLQGVDAFLWQPRPNYVPPQLSAIMELEHCDGVKNPFRLLLAAHDEEVEGGGDTPRRNVGQLVPTARDTPHNESGAAHAAVATSFLTAEAPGHADRDPSRRPAVTGNVDPHLVFSHVEPLATKLEQGGGHWGARTPLQGDTCGLCHVSAASTLTGHTVGSVVVFPCLHSFHEVCVRRDAAACPVCFQQRTPSLVSHPRSSCSP